MIRYCLIILLLFNDAYAQIYPQGQLITVDRKLLFDVTSARKRPDLLFDNDTTTCWTSDFFNGYILDMTNGQQIWIVLDSFISNPRVKLWNGAFAGGGQVDVQFYYSWQDTTRHSDVLSATLQTSQYTYVDSTNSRLVDSTSLIRIRIASINSDKFNEVRLYGTKLSPSPSIYPASVTSHADPEKYFQGYGKLYPDSLTDDAGHSERDQNDMDWLDTCTANGNGKLLTINIFNNHANEFYSVAHRNDRKIHSYFSGPRKFFKYSDNNTKDMPIGGDSTLLNTWRGEDSLYYGITAKFGNNTSASLTGYTYVNTPSGAGLGLIDAVEIGNEDDARWVNALRFHTPLVKLMKVKAGYNGVKRADATMPVISGAITGIDTSYMKATYFCNLLAFQTKVVPWDIYAINHYSTNTGVQASPGSDGVSPEQDQLDRKAASAVEISQRFNEGEIWMTEGGYDVFDGSNYDVPVISGQTREETKSFWVMRTFEIYAATRCHRFFQYTQRNLGGGDFSTTGFSYDLFCHQKPVDTLASYLWPFVDPNKLNSNDVYITLPSELYWHMVMRARVMEDYKGWPTVVQNGDSTGVWILRYAHLTDANKYVISYWSGTHNNTTGNVAISAPRNITSATRHLATVGLKDGTTSNPTPSGTNVTVPFNEGVQYLELTVSNITVQKFKGSLKHSKFVNSP